MDTIKSVVKWWLIVSGIALWLFITVYAVIEDDGVRRYDCSIAEISPDYPREVVNECRRMRSGKSIST